MGAKRAQRNNEETIMKNGFAFNTTRQAFLASHLRRADTHLSRLVGLMGTPPGSLSSGKGLWIVPCHGVHTFGMRYAIDLVYLDQQLQVIHTEENIRPWRVAPVRMESATVLELPSHTIYQTGTCIGDRIEISFTRNGDSGGQP